MTFDIIRENCIVGRLARKSRLPAYNAIIRFRYAAGVMMFKLIGTILLSAAVMGVARATTVDPVGAPEIDPASAISGVTLLLGGLAVLRGRRAR